MTWLTENWTDIVNAVTALVAAAAAVTALTPSPKDDNILKKIRDVLNVIGFNVGNAKNLKD
tara:strand:- start:216 stop:398 length:183 start_codon:yes stop_codon:yes gene_type:complete